MYVFSQYLTVYPNNIMAKSMIQLKERGLVAHLTGTKKRDVVPYGSQPLLHMTSLPLVAVEGHL